MNFDRPIRFERPIRSVDAQGAQQTVWTDYRSAFARREQLNATETYRARRLEDDSTHTFETYWSDTISEEHRILDERSNRIYMITEIAESDDDTTCVIRVRRDRDAERVRDA